MRFDAYITAPVSNQSKEQKIKAYVQPAAFTLPQFIRLLWSKRRCCDILPHKIILTSRCSQIPRKSHSITPGNNRMYMPRHTHWSCELAAQAMKLNIHTSRKNMRPTAGILLNWRTLKSNGTWQAEESHIIPFWHTSINKTGSNSAINPVVFAFMKSSYTNRHHYGISVNFLLSRSWCTCSPFQD